MDKESLPEAIEEKKETVDSVFLRTVVRKDIHDRLRVFSQKFSTGKGNWDFGVGIQILLDHYDESQLPVQSDKLDLILAMLSEEKKEELPKVEEPKTLEMLGGSKIVL